MSINVFGNEYVSTCACLNFSACESPLDLVFMIENSGAVGVQHFRKIKTFLKVSKIFNLNI